jgi:pilus assembly protein CpaE
MSRNITVSLVIKNDALRDEIATILAAQNTFHMHHSESIALPEMMIIELEDDQAKTFSLIHTILDNAPQTDIFLTAQHTDPDILLEALRAGVKEFIPQPLNPHDLLQALVRCHERHKHTEPQAKQPGVLINVMGAKGGVGTTTIAVNLAMSLQKTCKDASVALVDLHSQFGDVALFLDLEPTHTVGDIANNLSRLDATFCMRVLSRHASGLAILPSTQNIDEMNLLTPEVAQQTITLLQSTFDYIVLDCGHTLNDVTLTALPLSSTVLLVSALSLPVLRSTKRFLDVFSHMGYPQENIKVIVNRYKSKKTELSLRDLEDTLHRETYWTIPNEYTTSMKAISKGAPLYSVGKNSKLTKSILNLARSIAEVKPQKNSGLSKFFSTHN